MNDSSFIWIENTLQRSSDQARSVLNKLNAQNVLYKRNKLNSNISLKDMPRDASLDCAYSSVMKSLAKSTQICLNYYAKADYASLSNYEKRFCSKYLAPQNTSMKEFL